MDPACGRRLVCRSRPLSLSLHRVYIGEMSAERITNTLSWFTSQVSTYAISSFIELATAAAQDRFAALLNPITTPPYPIQISLNERHFISSLTISPIISSHSFRLSLPAVAHLLPPAASAPRRVSNNTAVPIPPASLSTPPPAQPVLHPERTQN
jgi:hypothetical protein